MIAVPAELAERERIKAERKRARDTRYNNSLKGREREARRGQRSHHAADELKYGQYPFIMWDGEAPTDTGYSLFGSSAGHEICQPHLTTEQCFDLLLEAKQEFPKSIFFWFGGRYDWDEITRQSIPMQKLARLKNSGTLHWHGYRLTEVEGKVYTIQKDGISVRIFETTGWFHTSYGRALRDYAIGTENCPHGYETCPTETDCECECTVCRIDMGKRSRAIFQWQDIDEIARYMRSELALGPALMDRVRKICHDAGMDLRSWYGPSALARLLMTRHKVFDAMAECPSAVNLAAQFAFAGGRFEPFRGGIITVPVYTKDKNSAYMDAALDLPNLRHGTWRKGKMYEPGKFAVYHIKYQDKSKPLDITKPQPLFRRHKNGNVTWPARVEGWYWSPEAELVANDPGATFIESYMFDEDNELDRPFAFVRELFRQRLVLQSLPKTNPSRQAEKAFKWALASFYGQLCRIVGWNQRDRKPPATHQLEWAGYITSHCRAAMYRVALEAGDSLVSIDTDSVSALRDMIVPLGSKLGEWKAEDVDGGIYFQSGVYFTQKNGEWSQGKMRGMERQRIPAVSPDLLRTAIQTDSKVKLASRRKYITTRMALNGQFSNHGKWVEHPGNILEFGGGGKRYHNRQYCKQRCNRDIHVFSPSLEYNDSSDIFDCQSYPHLLPWKDDRDSKRVDTKLLTDLLWVQRDDVDTEDEWLATLLDNYPVPPFPTRSEREAAAPRIYAEKERRKLANANR